MNVSQQTNVQYIMGLFSIEGQYVSFNVTNTKTVTEVFNQANKDQLIPLFEDLKNKAIPFTEDEVRNYHIQKDARWQYAFDVFKNNQVTTFQLNPVGVYIGIRQLTKICEMSIPMSLFYAQSRTMSNSPIGELMSTMANKETISKDFHRRKSFSFPYLQITVQNK